MRNEGIRDHERRGGCRGNALAESVGNVRADKGRRADNRLGAPEPAERDLTKTAPHRIADNQRARQHRGCRSDSEQHGQIGPPVEREAAGDEGQARHLRVPPFIS